MNRSTLTVTLFVALGLAAGVRAESALQGDPVRGGALYRLHCAACHGALGHGDGQLARNFDGVSPAVLSDPALLMQRGDADLVRTIAQGKAASGGASPMPAFGPRFAELDAWDVLAHLRTGKPGVADFFPDAARFTAKDYVLDASSIKRLEPLLGKLAGGEANVTVVAVFGGKKAVDGPVFVPQDPRQLDSLKPKRKLGYISVQPVALPGISNRVLLLLAMDREGFITEVRPALGEVDSKDRARLEKLLAGYAGQGGKAYDYAELKAAKLPAKDKDAKAASEVAKVLTRAYYRALEGARLFDKEERERHWAD